MRLLLTAGQSHDSPQAQALIAGYETKALLADKGYDTDALVAEIEARGAQAVIPPRSNRLKPREYDKELYKGRHAVECFIGKLKHYRRAFSRFEKLSKTYLGFLSFISALIWLR